MSSALSWYEACHGWTAWRPGMKAVVGRPNFQRARRTAEWGQQKYAGSWAEYLWRRLDVADFMNQAMLLAATLLLYVVPFMLIAVALAGRSVVTAMTVRLDRGLSFFAALRKLRRVS